MDFNDTFLPAASHLRNFWLVRRVLRCPTGILKHVSQNCVRDAGVVVAHTDVASPYLVLVCDPLNPLDQRMF